METDGTRKSKRDKKAKGKYNVYKKGGARRNIKIKNKKKE
jgi:hypothetical protein